MRPPQPKHHRAPGLILMNNSFVLMEARMFADRLRKEAGADPTEQVDLAFQLALGRKPAAKEREQSVAFLRAAACTA